jgi:hypothetical protein
MNIKTRQTIGVTLIAASILAAIVIQTFAGRVLTFRSSGFRYDVSPHTTVMFATSECIGFHWRYDIPLAAGFVIGFVCCAWPPRKPPRLFIDRPVT